jgi:hypothetical protein
MTQQPKSFKIEEQLIEIKRSGKVTKYLPVMWRLVWFRELYPNGTIDTEMIHLDLDRQFEAEITYWENNQKKTKIKHGNGYALFKARIENGEGGRATGHKKENAANFGDFEEKAECVPLDSEILTRRGFKRYDELTIGEDVLAYDAETDQCVWTPLLRVVTYPDAPLVKLHGKQFEVYCTPEHTWSVYYMGAHKDKKYEYRKLVQTQDLVGYQRIVVSAPAPGGDHPITPRDAAILGWLVTDGSFNRKGNSTRSYICQSKQETVEVVRELVGSLARESVHEVPDRIFPSGKKYECLPQHRFTFNASETRRIMEAAGISRTEDLPSVVSSFSQEARRAMLNAMMMADGDKRGYFGKKRKPGVMEAWRILATLEGYAISELHTSSAGEVPIQRLKKRRTVCVSELQIDHVGNTAVWCPTTKYGTWVMKQNDRVMITGNTGSIGRALAALGFGTQFTDEEFAEGERLADSPVERGNQNSQQRQQTAIKDEDPAVDGQIASIKKLYAKVGREPESLEGLTYGKAKEIIQKLNAEIKGQPKVEVPPRPAQSNGHQPEQARPATEGAKIVTEQQLNALLNLYGQLNINIPADLDKWSEEQARVGIKELSAKARAQKSA